MKKAHMTTVTTAIVGVTGYEGVNILRLTALHPQLRLVEVISRSAIGQAIGQALPSFANSPVSDKVIQEEVQDAQLVFLAIPHESAGALAGKYRSEGRQVIDTSAAFRFQDASLYEHWYGHPHPAPDVLSEAVYGQCEWQREMIRNSNLVANPGCFPTAAILALGPAFAEGIIMPDVIIDAKTGISGAGRSPSRRTHFVETSDSVLAYGVTRHRHVPEIESSLASVGCGRREVNVTFVPHLVAMNRGILVTCYATLQKGVVAEIVRKLYRSRYALEPFVRVIDQPPETSWVRGSNNCFIYLAVDEQRRRLVVISVIDNLMKGGAGQAVQNANLLYGFDETTNLEQIGIWP